MKTLLCISRTLTNVVSICIVLPKRIFDYLTLAIAQQYPIFLAAMMFPLFLESLETGGVTMNSAQILKCFVEIGLTVT